jgi:hypothetical protein
MNSHPNRTLLLATALGTVAQLAMVLTGHSVPAVANLFAIGGMSLSLLAGLFYGAVAPQSTLRTATGGGALAGGLSALIGITVSFMLGDVPAWVLAFGTLSSTIAGALGGSIGRLLRAKTHVAQTAQVK